MKVLVCGGRDYRNESFAFSTLDELHAAHTFEVVIHGDARGADLLGKEWAKRNDVPHLPFTPDWNKFGKRAGILRNIQMLDEGKPDLVVAFPGGNGTAHMVKIATLRGVKVIDLGSSLFAEKEPTMSQRKTFLRLLPVAAVAATTGVESETFEQLRHIVGANQNPTEENDGSFTAAQWTAARDAVRALDALRANAPKVRSVKHD